MIRMVREVIVLPDGEHVKVRLECGHGLIQKAEFWRRYGGNCVWCKACSKRRGE